MQDDPGVADRTPSGIVCIGRTNTAGANLEMCGIFAAYNYRHRRFDKVDFLEATAAVSHRGPDNLGDFDDGRCFLGHTRLSIVGLGAGANQPFEFENLVMVFNGEVYNYIELRRDLELLGYAFQTTSDTEVVIKAFHKWGGECLSKFNGMWALSIYDKATGKLFAARDRFGQKPLFALRDGCTLYLASELQQLVRFSDGEVDYGLIQMFLKEGTYDGDGRTFFRAIDEFPKAHYCEFDGTEETRCVRYWNYWNDEIRRADEASLSEFAELLHDAVRLRLRADVPFGLLLSGGVDSTIVAALARRCGGEGRRIPAYAYSSQDADDERKYAEQVANRLKLNLTVCEQEQDPANYRARLKQLVRHLGRGHSSPAIASVDHLYESVAKSGIRLALDGQGADELLAGYKTYFPLAVPLFLFKGKIRQAVSCLRDAWNFGVISAAILFLRNALPPPAKKALRWFYGYEALFRSYSTKPGLPPLEQETKHAKNKSVFNRFLIQQHDLGLGNLLFYGDIVAMKHSVENRSPFLDYRLVDFVFSKSEELKLRGCVNKYALRVLPEYQVFRDVLDRRKIGFSSDIQLETKLAMTRELRESPILAWPIFSKRFTYFAKGRRLESKRFERLLFRLYQVHLWNEVFSNRGRSECTASEHVTTNGLDYRSSRAVA